MIAECVMRWKCTTCTWKPKKVQIISFAIDARQNNDYPLFHPALGTGRTSQYYTQCPSTRVHIQNHNDKKRCCSYGTKGKQWKRLTSEVLHNQTRCSRCLRKKRSVPAKGLPPPLRM